MNPEIGVGDDNRTAVSDEEVEAAARVFFAQTQYTGPRAFKASCDIAREMLEAAAAARRDVPGGREAEQHLRAIVDEMEATKGWDFRCLQPHSKSIREARDWLASHP